MAIQAFQTALGRINKLKGEILAHAVPVECLGITGQMKKIPKNGGDTIIYRRWLPYGGTLTSALAANTWVVNPALHLTQEGVTPPAETISPQDITVQLQQYSCLYGVTDKTVDLYEDDVPAEMKKQTGQRMGLVRELIRYGVLKGCTNQFFAGGSSVATVSTRVTLPQLRKIARSLRANHTGLITSILSPSALFATTPVEAGYLVFCHTDAESDIRDLPGFKEVAAYGQRKTVHEMEIGTVENFRFIISPELQSTQNAGASVGATGLYSTGGSNIDVYATIVVGDQAWGDVALRGADSIDATWIPPGQKDKNDPLGQRGYVGAKFYAAAVVLNNGWMAAYFHGITALS
jgi:N4-gp56 family major capsid protein